jgi:hypothetical protein
MPRRPRNDDRPHARLRKAEARLAAFELFRQGKTVPQVAEVVGRCDRAVRYWRAEARAALAAVA